MIDRATQMVGVLVCDCKWWVSSCVALADWTGRIVRPDKRGAIAQDAPSVLARIDCDPRTWRCQVLGIESRYWRAVGSVDALLVKAAEMGLRWLKGCGFTASLLRTAVPT